MKFPTLARKERKYIYNGRNPNFNIGTGSTSFDMYKSSYVAFQVPALL